MLRSEVVLSAKGNRQSNLPEWHHRGPKDYTVEWRAAPFELGEGDFPIIEGFGEEDVESTTTVNQYPIELDYLDNWIQHQWVMT